MKRSKAHRLFKKLRTAEFRQRVVRDRTKYRRKSKHRTSNSQ